MPRAAPLYTARDAIDTEDRELQQPSTLAIHYTAYHSFLCVRLKCGDRSEPSLSEAFGNSLFTHPGFPFPFIYSLRTARQRSSRAAWGAIGASLVLSLPKPSLVSAHDRRRRASSAHSYTLSHMSIRALVRQRIKGGTHHIVAVEKQLGRRNTHYLLPK